MKEAHIATYHEGIDFARQMDVQDPLSDFRDQFHIPRKSPGEPYIYFCGNSLGLQPITTQAAVEQELEDWKNLGVEGHLHAKNPWMPYHEYLTRSMARLVGAKAIEVVVMNTLSVNLHLMMVSFYRPTAQRHKILIEYDAFPSDRYAVESQVRFHGYDPRESIIALKPRSGEYCLRTEDIQQVIQNEGGAIALILLGNTNYYTGQYFDMKQIAEWGHDQGCMVGFDCAHAAGNVDLQLHDSQIDFAVWCTYKYLNSGPGSVGACFVHEKHAHSFQIPRFAGWWGHNKDTRFAMRGDFDPIPGVESWQLSNPTILSLASIWASLRIFDQAGIQRLREKSVLLTGYLEYLLERIPNGHIEILTPQDPDHRGCQLSVRVRGRDRRIMEQLQEKGVIADWREPDVIRVAPVPLYNTFTEVFEFVEILKEIVENE